jgi:hypothetical protein
MNNDHPPRRHDDGRKVYVVGPVERWILGIAATVIVTVVYGYCNQFMTKLDIAVATGSRIEIAQAVTTSEVNEIKAKQSIMQAEVAKIPRLEIQVQANTDMLKEHNQMKNFK